MTTPAASPSTTPDSQPRRISVIDVVRTIVLIVAVASLVIWGLSSWAFPWNIVAAVGAPVVLLLVWALFLSPRPVLRTHPYVTAAVELLVYAGVTVAWWSLGETWVGLGFAVVAIAVGLAAGRRTLS